MVKGGHVAQRLIGFSLLRIGFFGNVLTQAGNNARHSEAQLDPGRGFYFWNKDLWLSDRYTI